MSEEKEDWKAFMKRAQNDGPYRTMERKVVCKDYLTNNSEEIEIRNSDISGKVILGDKVKSLLIDRKTISTMKGIIVGDVNIYFVDDV